MIDLQLSPTQIIQGVPAEVQILITNRSSGRCNHLLFNLDLPTTLLLIKGLSRVEYSRLEPQETVSHTLVVRCNQVGPVTIPINRLSYRGADGKIHQINDVKFTLEVLPGGNETIQRVQLQVEFTESNLVINQWGSQKGRVKNTGGRTASGLVLRLEGSVECEPLVLPAIPLGVVVPFEISIKPLQLGERVPVSLKIASSSGAVLLNAKSNLNVNRPDSDRPGQQGSVLIQGGHVDFTHGDRSEVTIGGDAVIVGSQIGGTTKPTGPPKCPKCGNVAVGEANFCVNCGAQL